MNGHAPCNYINNSEATIMLYQLLYVQLIKQNESTAVRKARLQLK